MPRALAGTLAAVVVIAPMAVLVAKGQQIDSSGDRPPHVQLTRDEDFERTRRLLGLSGPPPPGASGSDPATYDESQANPYPNLPDPLRFEDGRRVTTPEQWQERRAEILELFEREVYGRTPKETPAVRWEVLQTSRGTNGGVAVVTKELVGRVDNTSYPDLVVNIRASVTTPADAQGPVPVVLSFGATGFGAPADPLPNEPEPTTVCQPGGPAAAGRGIPAPAGRGAAAGRGAVAGRGAGGPPAPQGPTPQQQALARGWGYATVMTNSIQADNGQGLTCGIIGLVNRGQPRDPDDWGVLAAWAWGASRVVDYFETDRDVDEGRIALYGHSRWGKATLLAAALDPRIAVPYVSSSGHGGAKLHRRKYGELIENVADTYYYWMAGNYLKYAGNWDALPVDSHQLIALVAPRPVFLSAGNDPQKNPDGTIATRVDDQGRTVVAQANDAWIDPRGTFMAAVAASPVYELLGRRGIETADFPPLDTKLIAGDIGFHQHPGGHVSGPAWETFYTFAAKYFEK
ncbi:MAG: acetylxylan esterase [Acidobacteriota bacterium]